MQWRSSQERYGAVAQALHWGMFALIALQLVIGEVLDELPRKSAIRAFALDAHETLGLVVLLLVLARIAWKIVDPAPVATGPEWRRLAARTSHVLLYTLLVAIPIAGYVTVAARGHDPAFFAWNVPGPLGKDAQVAKAAENVHAALADVLIAVVALHVAAALWHHLIARDGVLRRMLPRRRGDAELGLRH